MRTTKTIEITACDCCHKELQPSPYWDKCTRCGSDVCPDCLVMWQIGMKAQAEQSGCRCCMDVIDRSAEVKAVRLKQAAAADGGDAASPSVVESLSDTEETVTQSETPLFDRALASEP